MQVKTANPGCAAPSGRAWATLIGAALLSAIALHMAKSTTAADLRNPVAQHSTLPIGV